MASTAVRQAPPDATGARAVLVLTCAATLLAVMNYTAPFTTLPATAAGLRAGPTGQLWILSSISVALAAAMLGVGSVADAHGRGRVFRAGMVLLAVATAVSAAAPNLAVFVAGRVVQGIGTAAVVVTSLGIVGHTFPTGVEQVRATAVWGAMIGGGNTLGPIATGALTDTISWRLWYWIAALGSLALAVAGRRLPESRDQRRRRLDVAGVVTMSGGLVALLAAITVGRTGWLRPTTVVLFCLATALLVAFLQVESHRREPMLDLALVRQPKFVLSMTGATFTGLSVPSLFGYLTTITHLALGLSVFVGALLLAFWSALSFVAALWARRLAATMSGRRQIVTGLVLGAIGELALLGLTPTTPWWRLLPGLAIAGIGSGLLNAALARVAVESVPVDRASFGSAANNTARYVGVSIGVAIVVAIVANAHGGSPEMALAHGANTAIIVTAGLALLGAGITALTHD